MEFLAVSVQLCTITLLINICIENAGLGNCSVHKLPVTKPPVAINGKRKSNQRSWKAAFFPKFVLHSHATPIRFSCAHAHIVNKMVSVAVLQRERENQLSHVLAVSCLKQVISRCCRCRSVEYSSVRSSAFQKLSIYYFFLYFFPFIYLGCNTVFVRRWPKTVCLVSGWSGTATDCSSPQEHECGKS